MSHFLRSSRTFPQQLHHFTVSSATCEGLSFSIPLPILRFHSFMRVSLVGIKKYLVVVLTSISPMTRGIEHLSMCLLAVVCLPWRNVYSNYCPFLDRVVFIFVVVTVVEPGFQLERSDSRSRALNHTLYRVRDIFYNVPYESTWRSITVCFHVYTCVPSFISHFAVSRHVDASSLGHYKFWCLEQLSVCVFLGSRLQVHV